MSTAPNGPSGARQPPDKTVNGIGVPPTLPTIAPHTAPRSVDEVSGGILFGAPIGISGPMALQLVGIVSLVAYALVARLWAHAGTDELARDPIIMTMGVYLTGNIVVAGGAAISHMFTVRGVVARAYVQQGVLP